MLDPKNVWGNDQLYTRHIQYFVVFVCNMCLYKFLKVTVFLQALPMYIMYHQFSTPGLLIPCFVMAFVHVLMYVSV